MSTTALARSERDDGRRSAPRPAVTAAGEGLGFEALTPGGLHIETFSGQFVDISAPDPASIRLTDVAIGLANQCRGSGQMRFISIAEHALLVARRLRELHAPPTVVLAGLHHDDPEAFLHDLTKPLKWVLQELGGDVYGALTDAMWQAISQALELGACEIEDPRVKAADDWALAAENHHQRRSHGATWACHGLYSHTTHPLHLGLLPGQAAPLWLREHRRLQGELAAAGQAPATSPAQRCPSPKPQHKETAMCAKATAARKAPSAATPDPLPDSLKALASDAAVREVLGDELIATLLGADDRMRWADDEIEAAMRSHPEHADRLWHSFALLRATDELMGSQPIYRSHCRELLGRVVAGADTRPGTAAECCIACAHTSQLAPFTTAAVGFYMRMWEKAGLPDLGFSREHHEAMRGEEIDRLERELTGRLACPWRRLAKVIEHRPGCPASLAAAAAAETSSTPPAPQAPKRTRKRA